MLKTIAVLILFGNYVPIHVIHETKKNVSYRLTDGRC